MISRVAESCFWLNRYAERVETLARMLAVNLAFQLDVDLPAARRWRPLLVVFGEQEALAGLDPEGEDDAERVQEHLVWNEESPSSLLSSLRMARENARTIRETVSLEMWESLNDLWVWIRQPEARRSWDRDRQAFYRRVRDQCLLFHGLAQGTMLHEDPFEFMRLGTALERVQLTARILDVKYHGFGPGERDVETPAESAQWLATLRSCAAFEPFFKRPENVLSGRAVAEFLLFDPAFPRSVLHNMRRARNFLGLVRPPRPTPIGARTDELLEETIGRFEARTVDDVLEEGLHEVLTWIVDTSAAVCDAVRLDFFEPEVGAAASAGAESAS